MDIYLKRISFAQGFSLAISYSDSTMLPGHRYMSRWLDNYVIDPLASYTPHHPSPVQDLSSSRFHFSRARSSWAAMVKRFTIKLHSLEASVSLLWHSVDRNGFTERHQLLFHPRFIQLLEKLSSALYYMDEKFTSVLVRVLKPSTSIKNHWFPIFVTVLLTAAFMLFFNCVHYEILGEVKLKHEIFAIGFRKLKFFNHLLFSMTCQWYGLQLEYDI